MSDDRGKAARLIEGGRIDRAMKLCREQPGIFTNIVLAGLEVADKGESAAKEAIDFILGHWPAAEPKKKRRQPAARRRSARR